MKDVWLILFKLFLLIIIGSVGILFFVYHSTLGVFICVLLFYLVFMYKGDDYGGSSRKRNNKT